MLLAGIELRPRDLASSSKSAVLVGLGGMIVPLALRFGLAWLFVPRSELWFALALFLRVALAITAVPAAVKVLLDLKRLDSRLAG